MYQLALDASGNVKEFQDRRQTGSLSAKQFLNENPKLKTFLISKYKLNFALSIEIDSDKIRESYVQAFLCTVFFVFCLLGMQFSTQNSMESSNHGSKKSNYDVLIAFLSFLAPQRNFRYVVPDARGSTQSCGGDLQDNECSREFPGLGILV